jgi:hypothetical protein
MFACYCLLRVLFGDFVGLGGDERDELDAAFYKEVARVFREGHPRLGGEDVLDDLLYGGCDAISCQYILNFAVSTYPLAATSRRCPQTRGQTWRAVARVVRLRAVACIPTAP